MMANSRGFDRRSAAAGVLDAGLVLCVAAGPVLYPAWLAVRTRRHGDPTPPVMDDWPTLSVVVPAYREQSVIVDKVTDVVANGYPGPFEVIVVADDQATAAVARLTDARVLEGHTRQGKSAALSRGVAAATGEVIVMTDANTVLWPGSLAAMVRWFADPSIGAVAGEKQVEGQGEGLYWRYESWLKRREFRLGTTVALVGELAAVRRSRWQPVPVDVAIDDLWIALDALEGGSRVAYEPDAVAVELAGASGRDTWERRTRVVAGTFDLLWRRRRLLVRRDLVAAELWGHKLLRQSVGPLAHTLGLALALRRSRRSIIAASVVGAHGVGLATVLAMLAGRTLPRIAAVGGEVLFLHAVAVAGTVRYARGDRPAIWSKPERTGELPHLASRRSTIKHPG